MVEFVEEVEGVLAERLVIHPGIGDVEVEDGTNHIEHADDADGCFTHGIDPCINHRKIKTKKRLSHIGADQQPAHQHPQNDGADGQAFDPAVGDHQQSGG